MEAAAAPASKLEEQATAKAELSYSYWAANAASGAPPPEPKKLTEEEAAAQQQTLKHTASGASLWNAAGTFEERALPLGWVQEQLAGLLAELRHSQGGAEVAVTGVATCTGEAHQWIRRGKKTAGFELCFEFRWRAQLGGEGGPEVVGSAKVPHAAADELDELTLEVSLDPASAAPGEGEAAAAAAPSKAQRQQAKAAAAGLRPRLEPLLEQLLERCRDK